MKTFKNWLTAESRVIAVVVVVLILSVAGTVGGSLFNAASVNNLTEAVSDVKEVNERVSKNTDINACRTQVQAAYDAALARILLGFLADDAPPGTLDNEYEITPEVLVHFEDSADELNDLEEGRICTAANPERQPLDEQ